MLNYFVETWRCIYIVTSIDKDMVQAVNSLALGSYGSNFLNILLSNLLNC